MGDDRSRRPARVVVLVVAVTLTLGLVVVAGPAGAGDHAAPEPLVDGLAGPLAIDVGHRGDVLVGQSFAGLVSRVTRQGALTDVVAEPGVSAVAHGWFGRVLYTVAGETGSSLLKVRDHRGRTRTIADLGAYEAARNPDGAATYGFTDISPECAAEWNALDESLGGELGPPQYTGIVESNPYAIAQTWRGTYVADAAGNSILLVDHHGRVRTVAVLPPQPLVVAAEAAAGLGLPDCVVGLTYRFEPVPTDVEVHRGHLYVSTLPGGPEDPSLGARGSVYRVDPRTGAAHRVATGFLAATDLAVSPSGTVYVTELFGDQVTKVTRRGNVAVASLPLPAAIEWSRGRLYVAHDVFESGKVTVLAG